VVLYEESSYHSGCGTCCVDWIGGTLASGSTINAPLGVARLVSACDAVRKASDLNTRCRWSIGRPMGGSLRQNLASVYVAREGKPVAEGQIDPLLAWQGVG